MQSNDTTLLFRSDDARFQFLPEGPQQVREDLLSWVAIQHGADAATGSIHTLRADGLWRWFDLPGRPGFAFPIENGAAFLVGLEDRIQRLDFEPAAFEAATNGMAVPATLTPLSEPIEADLDDTTINDGMLFAGGIIFGTKHIPFAEPKAGLYLWRQETREVKQLAPGQTCSNGKELRKVNGEIRLVDIDTPTMQVMEYPVDLNAAMLGEGRAVVTLEADHYPDGMVLTPDGKSLVVALYKGAPEPGEPGEIRQYGMESGQLEAVWRVPGAPQVTCPQWVRWNGKIQLVATTAVEHMSAELQAEHPNSGGIFIAPTEFDALPALFSS